MGMETMSVQFFNAHGETIFKIYVGRDAQKKLKADQVERFDLRIPVENPTACDVTITSMTSTDAQFTPDFTREVTLGPTSRRFLTLSASIATPGRHTTRVRITGSAGSEHFVDVAYVVAERALAHDASIAFGDASATAT